jgi:flagellin-like protein
MTSRRAVSPVIATVILIAVAVALGIAVAVWAGALTGSLQKTEKLVISAYPDANALPNLVISVTNDGASSVTITQVQWNSVPIPAGIMVGSGGFNAALPFTLASGATGYINMTNTNVVAAAPAGLGAKDGVQYPITIVTAAGNSYPSTVTWP